MEKQKLLAIQRKKVNALKKAPPLGETARGTVVERFLPCGKSGCACKKRDHKGHGPYHYLMIGHPGGKTQMVLLRKEQVPKVRRWVRQYKRVKDIIEKVTQMNVQTLKLERSE